MKDEGAAFATFFPTKKKDTQAAVDGMLHHFGVDINKANSCYSDGATAFKKMAKLLIIPTTYSTTNTPTSNSRHETFMRIVGDGRSNRYQ